MNDRPFLSHFSPQWTDPQYLEAILVQREGLLQESVSLMRESILSENKHHLLFVGSRGAGKTHLLTLIHHRLMKDAALQEGVRFAWLNEDETATSFLRLLVQIYRSLIERYPSEFPTATLSGLAGQDPATAQERLGTALLHDLRGRTLVCLMENFDSLFRDLPESEQRNWRAFIQNHPVFATVSTAQSLFNGIADRDQPFFGFFDTRHLEPLTLEEARTLLENVARLHGRKDLLEYLQSDAGHARVAAIRALAGGNPRLYLIFSDLLVSAQALDDLVRPFEEMIDRQLTSYYQERLRWLSPQQREIIQCLCRSRHPVPVKHIAEALFTTHNSITGQLRQLREMHYVHSHPHGREVLYELAEPLMRLALQVKETHDRKPLALIVDFLRVWHGRREIDSHLAHCAPGSPGHAYFAAASALLDSEPNLRHELLRRGLVSTPPEQCDASALAQARCLAEETGLPMDWLILGQILSARGEWSPAIQAFTRVIEHRDTPADILPWVTIYRGWAYGVLGQLDEAIADFTFGMDLPSTSTEQMDLALVGRGNAHQKSGRFGEAIADYTRIIELPDATIRMMTYARFKRGLAHQQMGRADSAIADLTCVVEFPNGPIEHVAWALGLRGVIHWNAGRMGEAIADYTRLISLPDAPIEFVAIAHINRAFAFAANHSTGEYLREIERGLDLCDGTTADRIKLDLDSIADTIVAKVFLTTTDSRRWTEHLTRFVGLFDRHDGLGQLGDAVVRQLPSLAGSPLNHAAWDAWADAWETARAALPAERQDRLEIALRLVRTGIAYLKTTDEGRLLSLVSEERRILREALKLPPERQA
jgi:tetratricopeptide (TPR) repeat protein